MVVHLHPAVDAFAAAVTTDHDPLFMDRSTAAAALVGDSAIRWMTAPARFGGGRKDRETDDGRGGHEKTFEKSVFHFFSRGC